MVGSAAGNVVFKRNTERKVCPFLNVPTCKSDRRGGVHKINCIKTVVRSGEKVEKHWHVAMVCAVGVLKARGYKVGVVALTKGLRRGHP